MISMAFSPATHQRNGFTGQTAQENSKPHMV
jgi:hypothetical protein